MDSTELEVIYEDNHLLAVVKPAGLPTMGVAAERPSLLSVAKAYVKGRYNKPGNVYLGAMSRLDCPTTGVVLLARTSKAAARLSEQFRTRAVEKTYWALVSGRVAPAADMCQDWLAKDERHRRMHVVDPTHPGALEARLRYRTLEYLQGASWLEISLETGRKHQIRVQMARRGHPVVGDRKYGSRQPFPHGIALHARRLVCEHPIRHEPVELFAPLPASWRTWGVPDA